MTVKLFGDGLNGLSIARANAFVHFLKENAGVQEALLPSSLDAKVHNIVLLFWRIFRVHERELVQEKISVNKLDKAHN